MGGLPSTGFLSPQIAHTVSRLQGRQSAFWPGLVSLGKPCGGPDQGFDNEASSTIGLVALTSPAQTRTQPRRNQWGCQDIMRNARLDAGLLFPLSQSPYHLSRPRDSWCAFLLMLGRYQIHKGSVLSWLTGQAGP